MTQGGFRQVEVSLRDYSPFGWMVAVCVLECVCIIKTIQAMRHLITTSLKSLIKNSGSKCVKIVKPYTTKQNKQSE